jgi:hypothetical protein
VQFIVPVLFWVEFDDVIYSRLSPLSPELPAEAEKTISLEMVAWVKHATGVLSMGQTSDPNSGTSSFSVLLGAAPHLDMQYTIFGCNSWCLSLHPEEFQVCWQVSSPFGDAFLNQTH